MTNRFLIRERLAVAPPISNQVRLDTEDGFDVALLRLLPELDQPVQCAVVGEGDGIHTEFIGTVKNLRNFPEAIQ